MKKERRPLRPFKGAYWNARLKRWEGWKKEEGYSIFHKVEPKNHKPMKPFKSAVWNANLRRWEGKPLSNKVAVKIRPKSKKRVILDKKYVYIKQGYLMNHSRCECGHECRVYGGPGWGIAAPSTQIHHIRGKVGTLLMDIRYFLAVCFACHRWIEDNRSDAKKLGWLASRDSKTIKLQAQ